MDTVRFHVVYQYHAFPYDDFIPVGIYTNVTDADAHNASLEGGAAHAVTTRTLGELEREMAHKYLGQIVDRLEGLAERQGGTVDDVIAPDALRQLEGMGRL